MPHLGTARSLSRDEPVPCGFAGGADQSPGNSSSGTPGGIAPTLPQPAWGTWRCGPGGTTAKYRGAQTDRIIDLIILPLAAYVAANLAVLALYGADKRRAQLRLRRISERTLLVSALVGPFGALGGMRLFHHKTRKLRFVVAVPLFAALHVGVIAALLITGGGA